jgi:uncharacterized protein YjbI with pentapeptide repeats
MRNWMARCCAVSFTGASLWSANLRQAHLGNTNLHGAKLDHADLGGADLRGADLADASFWGALFEGADLPDAEAAQGESHYPWGARANCSEFKDYLATLRCRFQILYMAAVL